MPVLEVEIVGEPERVDRSTLAQRLADAAAVILKSPPQGTWIRLRVLHPQDYAESGGTAADLRPVFVSVMTRLQPTPETVESEVRELTAAIAAVCNRPLENVHVRYELPGAGRQAFGGRIVR
jgi:phenylpyruvate tautomerase PptA (4-oxalocrotonate tautomerase family)